MNQHIIKNIFRIGRGHNMADFKNEEKAEEIFSQMMKNGDFKIIAVPDEKIDLREFKKSELGPAQTTQINALLQQLPVALSAGSMATAYRVEFPKGIVGTLTKLKQGGYSTTIKGTDGKFAGTASLYSMGMEAAVLGAFTAMSVVTGQFFLARINAELNVIKEKLDQILQFLYGDKKAELIAEISFIKYASENFGSIMGHTEQQAATISSIQEAKKVAMKDIQFYLNDLDELGKKELKKYAEITDATEKALQIKESLDLSIQLYMMSSLLEIYYAQNFDKGYLDYVKEDVNNYIDMCKNEMVSSFARLEQSIRIYKPNNAIKDELAERFQKLEDMNESLKVYGSNFFKIMQDVWQSLNQKSEYYFTVDGNVYLKAS